MKQFFVLISFVAVNVLAEDLREEYKKQLVNTNRQIKMVLDRKKSFDGVIKNIVRGDTSMMRMAFMFAAPNLEIGIKPEIRERLMEDSIDCQRILQDVIHKTLGVSVPGKGILNTALRTMGIPCETIGPVNTVMRTLVCPCVSIDLENPELSELEEERIKITSTVVKQFLKDTSDRSVNGVLDCKLMCRLKGLYRSILKPADFIDSVEVKGDKCVLTTIQNNTDTIDCAGESVHKTITLNPLEINRRHLSYYNTDQESKC